MQLIAITRVLGVVLILFSLCNLPPIVVELIYRDGGITEFIKAFLFTLGGGALMWVMSHRTRQELRAREGFLIVVLVWTVLSLFGALPFMIIPNVHLSFTDSVFEAISGLTTTGASVIPSLVALPHSLLFYRQELQFFGGMGILVLTVAVLPVLGIGGMQLFRAETPGPMKDSKLTPRITETAKALWLIYVGLTLIGILAFWLAGMGWFDAVCESFGTVSTGGFSTHDNSFAFYHNNLIRVIAIGLMWLGGTNFSLHFMALKHNQFKQYVTDSEFKTFILVHVLVALLIASNLLAHHLYDNFSEAFIQSLFNVVSIGTTSGFIADPFANWPTFSPVLIMLVGLIGGCSGSTAGGIKVIRTLLLQKQASLEIKRLIHPRAVVSMKFGRQILPSPILQSMWSFLGAFFMVYTVLLLALLACDLDLTTAFGALTSAMANVGAGLGRVAVTSGHLSDPAKWILNAAMLIGRLEVFAVLVLFSRTFWLD